MRTRTTYVALLFAVVAGSALTLVSCAPDETTTPDAVSVAPNPQVTHEKVLELREKYGWIGKYHSDGLAYIYSQLAKKDGTTRNRVDMCRLATKALKDFHKSARIGEVPTGLLGPSFQNETCLDEAEVAPLRRSVLAFLPGAAPRADLSAAAMSYIERLGAVPDNSTSLYEFLTQVDAIEYEAAATLNSDEAGAVSAVAAVARSSVHYWEENLDSWLSLPGALPMPYSVSVGGIPGGPTNVKYPSWWNNPAVKGFRKIIGIDIMAGGRTAYTAWALGPIGWEAVAASALFGSATATVALLFF